MDTVKISFCNSNGYSISNVRSKTKIINQIKERYQLDVFNNNTRIYNDYILDILKKNKYLLCCLITTARPYIMFFKKAMCRCSPWFGHVLITPKQVLKL